MWRHRDSAPGQSWIRWCPKTLFLRAAQLNADALVLLDSDGQHETSDIPKLLAPILAGEADFAIGSRFVDGGGGTDMPAYRRLGIKVITAASNLSSDLGIRDTQSGFRAFSRTALERLRFDSEGMELSLEMLEDAHEKQLKVLEVPTVIRYDVPKGSNFTAVSHGFTVMTLGAALAFPKETIAGAWYSWIWTPCRWSGHGLQHRSRLYHASGQYHRLGHICSMDWPPRPCTHGHRTGVAKRTALPSPPPRP